MVSPAGSATVVVGATAATRPIPAAVIPTRSTTTAGRATPVTAGRTATRAGITPATAESTAFVVVPASATGPLPTTTTRAVVTVIAEGASTRASARTIQSSIAFSAAPVVIATAISGVAACA
ncbi:hypothetical protein ABZ412_28875 [Nocardia sp. NPDC005746]|uniref:hypothetical protein n=1 Tax=Nocardia sp. NPDC005746 TaxID=3157062 RepID=UPI0033FEFC7C